jgi:hypothetical protein
MNALMSSARVAKVSVALVTHESQALDRLHFAVPAGDTKVHGVKLGFFKQ